MPIYFCTCKACLAFGPRAVQEDAPRTGILLPVLNQHKPGLLVAEVLQLPSVCKAKPTAAEPLLKAVPLSWSQTHQKLKTSFSEAK